MSDTLDKLIQVVNWLNIEMFGNVLDDEFEFMLNYGNGFNQISLYMHKYSVIISLWNSEEDGFTNKESLRQFIYDKIRRIGYDLDGLSGIGEDDGE